MKELLPKAVWRDEVGVPGVPQLTLWQPSWAQPAKPPSARNFSSSGLDDIPLRFSERVIGEEDFVVAARVGHPFLKVKTLDSYCEQQHILVSVSGDPRGFIDIALESKGRARRIAMVAPHFMLALAALSETDLIAALPRSLVRSQAARFGVASVDLPMHLPSSKLRAIVPQVALRDVGLAWSLERVERAATLMRLKKKGTARRESK